MSSYHTVLNYSFGAAQSLVKQNTTITQNDGPVVQSLAGFTRLLYSLAGIRLVEAWIYVVGFFTPAVCPWYHPLVALRQVSALIAGIFYKLCYDSPVFWAMLAFSLAWWTRKDYDAYLRVGRGGTPSTPWGWWRTKRLNFVLTYVLRVNVLSEPFVDPTTEPYRGKLFDLPSRSGARPRILGLAPQRQADQKISPRTELDLVAMLETKARVNSNTLVMGKSYLEGHLRALKSRLDPTAMLGEPGTAAEWGGEIAHIHKLDGSAHVVLHPADCAEVIRAGWGERHPLAHAAESSIWTAWFHGLRRRRLPLPNNAVLVYAPRTPEEMAMFERIVDAGIWWATVSRGQQIVNNIPRLEHRSISARPNPPRPLILTVPSHADKSVKMPRSALPGIYMERVSERLFLSP